MRTTAALAAAALSLACAGVAQAKPDLIDVLPGNWVAGSYDFNGPTSNAGTWPVAYGSVGPAALNAPDTAAAAGFGYSWYGADYSVYVEGSYSTTSTATTTTISGTLTLTCSLTNSSSTLAYINAMAQMALAVQVNAPCTYSSTWWSPTFDPVLATTGYTGAGAFANTGSTNYAGISSFNSSGVSGTGLASIYAAMSMYFPVENSDLIPQTAMLNFSITAELIPAAPSLGGPVLALIWPARRRRRA